MSFGTGLHSAWIPGDPAGFGVVDGQGLAVGVGDRQFLVAEPADLRMVDRCAPAPLRAGAVARPQLAEERN
jgi:hypothetical protein